MREEECNMEKVCVVIVLYNDHNEFRNCLMSLERQSRIIDHYIFIDNSNDEFSKLNKEVISSIELSPDRVTYVSNKENRGSAFGFALGMWIALQNNFDLIWLNDQDGVADKNCLEKIVESYEMSAKDVGIYVPNVCDLKTKKALPGFHVHVNLFLHGGMSEDKKINTFGTAGVCITHDTIKKIGYYNYTVCYIGNEDKEYALRARKNHLKIKYINHALYYHPDAFEKYKMKRKMKKYFLLQYLIPLNMGLIMKGKENDLRSNRLCESSAYINYKYASTFCKSINYIYCVFRALFNKSCNIKATLKNYRKGKEAAYGSGKNIYDETILRDFYINGSQ